MPYEVPIELLKLYQDASVRNALAGVVKPVKEKGIDSFEIRINNLTVYNVTKDDVDSFDVPENQELISDEVHRQAFSIIGLSFKEDNTWRLSDGQNTFPVAMKDTYFQQKVDKNQVAFAKGDVLICDLRTIQWQVGNGIKTEYEVIKVVHHRPARQLVLFDDVDKPSSD